MAKIYDFSTTASQIFVCGGCEGKFNTLFSHIIPQEKEEAPNPFVDDEVLCDMGEPESQSCNDALIIVTGNNRFGYKPLSHYTSLLEGYNETLKETNTHVLFIRGVDDDPSYFEDNLINLSNIKTIEDYSIVKINKHVILCIGGGVSYNRIWKTERMSVCPNPSSIQWANEQPVLDVEKINEILASDVKITSVISYAQPIPSKSTQPTALVYWSKLDKTLKTEWDHLNTKLIQIKTHLSSKKMKPKWWVCGEYSERTCSERWSIPFFNVSIHRDGLLNIEEKTESNRNRVSWGGDVSTYSLPIMLRRD